MIVFLGHEMILEERHRLRKFPKSHLLIYNRFMKTERGHLKIFFGYTNGVGKTETMLLEAHLKRKDGKKVLIGYVKEAGYVPTEGIEIVPPKIVSVNGIESSLIDIDKIISLKPDIVVIDEMAKRNDPGARNLRRFLDIQELLGAGIDVYTTLNVTELESLAGKFHHPISETVPDYVFDNADAVQMIDHKPEEIAGAESEEKLKRLRKLREVALRKLADRVAKKEKGAERIFVLISPSPSSAENIKAAARLAKAANSSFAALYVETSGHIEENGAAVLKDHMRLVRDLGGEFIVKYGKDVVETIVDYVSLLGIGTLVIGKSWRMKDEATSLESQLITALPNVQLIIIPSKHSVKKTYGKKRSLLDLFKKKDDGERDETRLLTIHEALIKAKDEGKSLIEVLRNALRREAAIIDKNLLIVEASDSKGRYETDEERKAQRFALENDVITGKGAEAQRLCENTYFPLKKKGEAIALIALSGENGPLSPSDILTLESLKPLIALLVS